MSERIGVIRDNGVVVNVILWGDETDNQLLADGITDFEEITSVVPMPGIGWTWSESEGFRPPKPFASWSWEGSSWAAPIAMPSTGGPYTWNENDQSWDVFELPS